MIKLVEVKLKGNFLQCKNPDIPLINIPKGSIIGKKTINDYEFMYEKIEDVSKLVAKNIKTKKEITLLPIYCSKSELNFKGRNINLIVRGVRSDSEYCLANSIIQSNHYLSAPNKGMVIVIEIDSDEDFKFLKRKLRISKKCSFLEKMLCNNSKIIGCAVIDKLTYGSPKGRMDIAKQTGVENYLKNGINSLGEPLHRNDVIKLLKVSWVSRFAILSRYQGIGIGTILAEHTGIVSSMKMIPEAKYIEVFTSHRKEVAQSIIESKQNSFLINAGYTVYNELLNCKPFFDKNESKFIAHKKLYYYKKVGS